jgi:photosystem II stability/assembly factor-like uncharacterized protein
MKTGYYLLILSLLISSIPTESLSAQDNSIDSTYLSSLEWRSIGPFRGGRSAAVTGVEGKANLFYFGSTGGGLWRTTDAGNSWKNISDGYFGGSIGAVAVSPSDPNTIYVGQGEETVRGNLSSGFGIWKTTDAGKTWQHMGLKASKHISRIRIHPKNPEILYVAALGNLYKDTEQRGVYKSIDGGKSWQRILFSDAGSGAVDLVFDPTNPRTLYASTWTIRRTPYSLSSGGEGSKLWKSIDEGASWKEISAKEGFPKGLLGIIGVAVSPVNSDRIWAMVENEPDGGLYRSDDGGETWRKLNNERALRQRAWYYTRIYAHPTDVDQLYVMNVAYHHSKDGGKTFNKHYAPHGDHHDLWIDPSSPERMIIGDDGGAQISFDAGQNWTTYYNQPTAQFYRVKTDNSFPFRIYGGQQDNSSIRIKHRSDGGFITEKDWERTAGGEAGHHAVYAKDNDIVFGGEYGGFMQRINHKTNQSQATNVWPNNPLGHGVENMKYRFQWNYPLFFSQHKPEILYSFSNHVHRSTDMGRTWETISPDLTTNDTTKQGPSGGPITKDNTAVEYYCTIFAAAESALDENILWTGSDDGKVHISRDAGANWDDVTPMGIKEFSQINSMETDPFNAGGIYLAATRYKWGDFEPYLYYSKDYGENWKRIDQGINREHFTRVIRCDPNHEGLLFAGTENGLYLSVDAGQNWQRFQMNLPLTPITDLAVKDRHLIAATQGRGFWILDDLSPLYEMSNGFKTEAHLFQPKPSYLMQASYGGKSKTKGENHPNGAIINYYLETVDTAVENYSLNFYDNNENLVRSFSSDAKDKGNRWIPKSGGQRFVWNMREAGYKQIKGMILWNVLRQGPYALPGTYRVEMIVGEKHFKQEFDIVLDPRVSIEENGLEKQHQFLEEIKAGMAEINDVINEIRRARKDLKSLAGRCADTSLLSSINEQVKLGEEIEKALYQTQNRSPQDPLNYPVRLNNKYGHLGALASIGFNAPTASMLGVKDELEKEIQTQVSLWKKQKEDLKNLNAKILASGIELIKWEE